MSVKLARARSQRVLTRRAALGGIVGRSALARVDVPSKYRSQATEVDGIRFHSKAEARRYAELKLLVKAGEVKDLELQPRFPLYSPTRHKTHSGGTFVTICTYVADFRYRQGPSGVLVVEDVKGVKTPLYRLKKKWFEAQYGLTITETK